jgi:tRNA U34 5-methylaminomethyl-2-thiouridine-forming methyltransferase MnmC
MSLTIITTGDGSHSLRNEALNETYHSVHGAVQESVHVFIRNGLEHRLRDSRDESLAVFEVGFGTGLNALLTANYALENAIPISYTSIEGFPVPEEIWRTLNYAAGEDAQKKFYALHEAPWEVEQDIVPRFRLRKMHITLEDMILPASSFDVIYFDAFAPNKQPELWTLPILEKVATLLKPGGVFVTYCAKGQLKRDLKSLSLTTETLPGPPGKKEMVRATRAAAG